MAREAEPLDVDDAPDLARVAAEVHESGRPRLLRRHGEDLALLVPVPARKHRPGRVKTPEDVAAFLSAAGSWREVDTDALIADIYESRRRSSRPPVDL